MPSIAEQQGGPFGDLYAAIGWHPQHRRLLQLLANATATGAGGGWDAAALASAIVEAAGGAATSNGSNAWWGSADAAGGALVGPSGGAHPQGSSDGPVNIGWLGLLLSVLIIGVNGLISFWLRLGLHGKLAVATVRCALLSVLLSVWLSGCLVADWGGPSCCCLAHYLCCCCGPALCMICVQPPGCSTDGCPCHHLPAFMPVCWHAAQTHPRSCFRRVMPPHPLSPRHATLQPSAAPAHSTRHPPLIGASPS